VKAGDRLEADITGAQNDVQVLSAILDAVDAGHRVEACHAAAFHTRFSRQIEVASSDEILAGWSALTR
jgi:hypothetical protein